MHLKATGSRMQPLLLDMSILKRAAHSAPSLEPAFISFQSRKFSSTLWLLHLDSIFCIRSVRMVSTSVVSMYILPSLMSFSPILRMASKESDVYVTTSGSRPKVAMSRMIPSTKSTFSLSGFVSSKRTMSLPLYRRAK